MVYSTCSSNAEENEAVVDEALSMNENFKLLNCTKIFKGFNKGCPGYNCSNMCLNMISSVDCTNGFFIAVFIRCDSEEDVELETFYTLEKHQVDDDAKATVKTEENTSEIVQSSIQITVQPPKMSRNQRRRARRLKLEQSNGCKSKKMKVKL